MGNRPPRNDGEQVVIAPQPAAPLPNRETNNNNAFMNAFFQQNQDLGLFGLIAPPTHPNQRRIKAHANKARAVDIPFDVIEGSVSISSTSVDPPVCTVQLSFNSTQPVTVTVWLQPVEKRSDDEYNTVNEINSSLSGQSTLKGQPGARILQSHSFAVDLANWIENYGMEKSSG